MKHNLINKNKLKSQSTAYRLLSNKSGFTIVELLVVIVAIGILASVVVVSYTGVSQKATAVTLQSDLDNASKTLKMYNAVYNSYPTTMVNNCPTLPVDNSNYCIKSSADGNYQYQATGSTFCITETRGNISYYIDQDGKPISGGCSGDWLPGVGAVTNLSVNPSFEAGISGFSYNNITVGSYSGVFDSSLFGSRIMRLTSTSTTSVSNTGPYTQVYNIVPSEPYYFISAWVRTSKPMGYRVAAERRNSSHVNIGTITGDIVAIPANTWTQLSTLVPTTAGIDHITFVIYSDYVSWVPGDWVDFDGLMVVKGDTLLNYADGNSRNWVWDGATNYSTSHGPAI